MRVILIQPHKHDRQRYPAGSALEVSDSEADWLIAHGVAGLPFIPGADLVSDHQSEEHKA